jgi:hypothetical protein
MLLQLDNNLKTKSPSLQAGFSIWFSLVANFPEIEVFLPEG